MIDSFHCNLVAFVQLHVIVDVIFDHIAWNEVIFSIKKNASFLV